jgi:hypothetical protein
MDCTDYPVVRVFRGCGLVDGFLKIWKESFFPHINQLTGNYSPVQAVRQKSHSSPILLPVPKRARLDTSIAQKDTYDEAEMDRASKEYFLGM